VQLDTKTLPDGPSLTPQQQAFAWAARPLQFLSECAAAHGDEFSLRLPGLDPVVLFGHPEALREIFTADPMALYAGRGNGFLEPILGPSSLLCVDGRQHARMRRLMAPALSSSRNARHGETIRELTRLKVESWLSAPWISLQDEMSQLTLDVILHALIGTEETDERRRIKKSSAAILKMANTGAVFGPPADEGSQISLQKRLDDQLSEYRGALIATINKRRAGAMPQGGVLDLLMDAHDPAGDRLTDSELCDQGLTLLLAGHETTATTLTWCIEALLLRAEIMARLTAEVDELGEEPTLSDVEGAPYLQAVLNETLRWMPVLPAVSARLVMKPVTVMGRTYQKGVHLLPCPYLTHRREELYPQAEEFRPERFLDRAFSPYEFLPFGGGPRRCIGMLFAMFEMKLILAAVLSEVRFITAATTHSRAVRRRLTVAPLGGVRVKVARRRDS